MRDITKQAFYRGMKEYIEELRVLMDDENLSDMDYRLAEQLVLAFDRYVEPELDDSLDILTSDD